MKKVAILTLVFYNYGTRLQSYALCKVLKKLFPRNVLVEVINTEGSWNDRFRTNVLKYLFGRSFKKYGLKAFRHVYEVFKFILERRAILKDDHRGEEEKRISSFRSIISSTPYSSYFSFNDIRSGKLPKYDAYIVGSDQVWNGIKVDAQDIYMLDFLNNKKGLTYAASFGMTTIPETMKEVYRSRINNFSSLLIREQEGIDLCKQLGRDDAQLVLDPTLLLERNEYESIMEPEPAIEGDFILVYSLNYSYKIYEEAYRLSRRNSCRMVVLKRSFCPPDIRKYDNSYELYAESPEQFLWLINNAKCVITNSYHALLFSIIFNRVFYLYLDNADEENSRLTTVVDMFDLKDHTYWETGHLPSIIYEIDYSKANLLLREERSRSLDMLEESLRKELCL